MNEIVVQIVNYFIALVLSLSVHEAAHAWAAKVRGDDTAESEGRLTLHPMAHMDMWGTVIIPLFGMFSMLAAGIAIPMFGWAKPVPVNLNNLKNRKWDHVFVAAAGPLSNLILCTIFLVGTVVYIAIAGENSDNVVFNSLLTFIKAMIGINALLCFFNLIPLPPLDGATVFSSILPGDLGEKYEEMIAPYGMMILLLLLMTGGLAFIRHLSSAYTSFVMGLMANFT